MLFLVKADTWTRALDEVCVSKSYRWLVTRHPAQFERMDFTAQILQSASRARKAFYECGWTEAKVLIRPSDGKFERTPFFDTIIRRGLRNSTRFDASTLTEEEIKALGMHRDETLGFKLQIRQFRNNPRKELPPLGRGGGAGRLRSSTPSGATSASEPDSKSSPGAGATVAADIPSVNAGTGALEGGRASHAHSALRNSPVVGGDVAGGCGGGVDGSVDATRGRDARASVDEAMRRGQSPRCWGGDGVRVSASGHDWPDGTVWPNGNRVMEAVGRRVLWTPRENAGSWDFRRGCGSASNGERERYADHSDDTRYPENGMTTPLIMPPWSHPHVTAPANRECRHPWQGPAALGWGSVDGSEHYYRSSMGVLDGRRVGDGGDVEPCRQGSREANTRDCRGGSKVDGVNIPRPPGRQAEAGARAGFGHQVEHLARKPVGRTVALPLHVPSALSAGEARGTPEPADGGLLTQGYLRLAAMNHGGDDTRRAVVNSSTPRYDTPGFGVGGAKPCAEGLVSRRSDQMRPVGPFARPGSAGYPSGSEDGPAPKRCRSLDGPDESGYVVGSASQHSGSIAIRGQSDAQVTAIQPWLRGRGASTPPNIQGDLLARELAQSERELGLARNALDEAQERFEKANQAHQAKREQAFTAAGKRSADAAHTLEERGSLNSLVRPSSDDRNKRSEPTIVHLSPSRPAASPEPRHTSSRSPSPSPSAGSAMDCADEMREVKREAALLYGIGRAPVSHSDSPPCTSAAPAPVSTATASSGGRKTNPSMEPPRSTLSRNNKAPDHSRERSSACSPPSSPPSPLPNLTWAIPNVVSSGRAERGRQPPPHGFVPLAGDSRRVDHARKRVGSPANRGGVPSNFFPPPALAIRPTETAEYAHRPIATRGALLPMAQEPGSPSASGETDSDHSDSTSGAGAPQDDVVSHHRGHQQQQKPGESQSHKQPNALQASGFRHVPSRGGQHWGVRSGGGLLNGNGESVDGYVAPLARLAAVATAGAR